MRRRRRDEGIGGGNRWIKGREGWLYDGVWVGMNWDASVL